jgi:hypothetical protein
MVHMLPKKTALILLPILSILSTGCQPLFPKVQSSFVSLVRPETFFTETITADGAAIITDDLEQINLSTGEEHRVYQDFVSNEWLEHYSIQRMDMMVSDEVVLAQTYDLQEKYYTGEPVFKLDFLNQSISEPLGIMTFHNPSPFGKRLIAYSIDPDSFSWQVFDITTNAKIPIVNASIRYDKMSVKASEDYLWSSKTNLPVAYLNLINPINFSGEIAPQVVGIYPIYGDDGGYLAEYLSGYKPIYQSDPPDNIVGAQFSPDGNFILASKWICDPSDPRQCSRYDLGNDDQQYDGSVTDTALILINWRTGEVKELIRLSQVDPSNVIGLSTEWSADGSTILVWRKEASPVVIKFK